MGRDAELAQLGACFDRLESGLAQVVAVVGDAGLGKSRLVYEFKRRIQTRPVTFFDGRCSSLGQGVPYTPFLGLLKHYFGLVPGESVEQACAKVDARLGPRAKKAEGAFPALTRLLGLRLDDGDGAPAAEEVKRETLEAITGLLLKESETAPAVVTLEDLHWIDEPSRELLDSLLARLVHARAMVLVTHRPDDRASWRTRAALTQLVLGRLPDDAVRSIARAVAGGPLPEALEGLVVAKTEGSPFYAEEFTRALVEEGSLVPNGGVPRLTRPVEEIRIPGTVQEVIAARLDRLGPQGKRVVQAAAILGRQFHRRELQELLGGEVIDLGRELAELERRGIFHRKSLVASDEYRFGESVTQEVAYEGLLHKQRRQLHERVAQALEATPAEGPERAALLAHHYERSDNRAKALAALLHAGRETERLPSYRTAAEFYRRAWDLAEAELAAGGDPRFERTALEATSGMARLAALFGAMSLVDAEPAVRRGRELAERLGDDEALAAQCYFNGSIIMQSDPDNFAAGLALAEQGLAVAQRAGLKLAAIRLSRGLAISYAHDGRFDLARRAIGWSAGEAARLNEPPLSDLTMSTRWVRDAVAYLSDDFDVALVDAEATYELARQVPNRTVTSGSAGTLAQIRFLRAEYAEARRWAEESLAIAEEIANVAAFSGAAAVALATRHELGETDGDARYLGLIEQGIAAGGAVQMNVRFLPDALRAVDDRAVIARFAELLHLCPAGGRLRQATALASLAELWVRVGRHEDAHRALTRAVELAEAIGARSVLATATLGAAELAAARGDRAASAQYLERAVAAARELGLRHYLTRAARVFDETTPTLPEQA
jgi:tetratricopeptide (TPR) repeat protein